MRMRVTHNPIYRYRTNGFIAYHLNPSTNDFTFFYFFLKVENFQISVDSPHAISSSIIKREN